MGSNWSIHEKKGVNLLARDQAFGTQFKFLEVGCAEVGLKVGFLTIAQGIISLLNLFENESQPELSTGILRL
jgi:hypothetical protein